MVADTKRLLWILIGFFMINELDFSKETFCKSCRNLNIECSVAAESLFLILKFHDWKNDFGDPGQLRAAIDP